MADSPLILSRFFLDWWIGRSGGDAKQCGFAAQ